MPRPPSHFVEKKLISDLSGGLNDTNIANLIKDNELQTATNVFCNLRGGVEKRYGYVDYAAPNSTGITYATTTNARILAYRDVTNSINDALIWVESGIGATTRQVLNITNLSSSPWVTYGSNGTATFTQNSTTVTLATGTAEWLTQIAAGDYINSGADGGSVYYKVSSVTDNSTIVLTSNYLGTTNTSAYVVRQVTTSDPAKGVMFNGNLWYGPSAGAGSAGTSCVIRTTNVASRRFAGPANQKLGIFESHKNYLFGVDTSYTNPSRVWWSASLDGTTWPSTNFVDVNPNDGDAITALVSHNGILYIFKHYSIWYLIGDVFDPSNPTFQLVKVVNPQNIGATSGETARPFQDKIIFLGPDGIYAIEGVGTLINLSENKIRTTIRSIQQRYAGYVNGGGNSQPEACAIVYDNRYWLSCQLTFAGNFVNDTTICMEPNGAFTRHSFAFNNMILVRNGLNPQVQAMLGISSANWDVFYFDGTAANDGASAINSTLTTKIFSFGDFSKTTRVLDVFVAYENKANQAATLKVYDDGGQVGSSTAWTFPGGTTQFMTVQRFEVNRDTNTLYLTITDNTLSKSFRVMGIIVVYEKDAMGSGVVVTS